MCSRSAFPIVQQLVASSVRISEKAGQLIRSILLEGNLDIVEKGKNDVQTRADVAAQDCIIGSLRHQFPNHKFNIIGEESLAELGENMHSLYFEDHATSKVDLHMIETGSAEDVLSHKLPEKWAAVDEEKITVWVDPLDGTSEFSQSQENAELREHVTVLIGVAVDSEPVAGVIHQPFYQRGPSNKIGRTIWGIDGLGSFGLDQKPIAEGNIITTSRSHQSAEVKAAIKALEPTDVIAVGGAGHKVLLVIEGRAHAYVFASPGCKKWDTCAPEAVLRALGGTLTDIHGNKIAYHSGVAFPNKGGVLATPAGVNHQNYVDRIPQEIRNMLKD